MAAPLLTATALTQHRITVLLIDDQRIVGEAVRRALADEQDIDFHFCSDPTAALSKAQEIQPTLILQDLVMPELDGLTLVKFFRANPATRDIPLIVLSTKEEPTTKAEAFALGANDYLVKLPDKIELIARIRYHSRAYINLLERNEAYQALVERERLMEEELQQASQYVQSLLPGPITGKARTDWRFVPSATLGGDTFGYHWLDDNLFACYLLDVCGHGVRAALLSVSVLNVIRSQSLPECDFRQPAQVLTGLNQRFPMEQQFNMFFTIWYGVVNFATRTLEYAGGGHPDVFLYSGPTLASAQLIPLPSQGPIIGAFDGEVFESGQTPLAAANRLYLFSDGVFEVKITATNEMWEFDAFRDLMSNPQGEKNTMDVLFEHVRALRDGQPLQDDFSILQIDL